MTTKKQKRAEIAAKRKRMGLSAKDDDDADDGVAYDPQLLTIARDRKLLQVFEKKAGSLHGSIDYDEFEEALELLEITDYDKNTAKQAFKDMDLENEDELEFEPFVYAVHGAYPKYNLIWNEIMKKKKYLHFRTIEGPYSTDQLKSILKNKNSEFKDKMTALRCCCDMIADPNVKDKDSKQLFVKVLPGLLAALRCKNQYVVRQASITLADIAKSKKKNLQSQVAKILNVCWEVFDSKSLLASYSTNMLSKALLKFVPDDADNKVLKTLIQGTQLKDFEAVQNGCYDGINVYLKKAANPKAKIKPTKDFWELVKNVIVEGIKSNDKIRKQRCYQLLVNYEKANDKKAQRITATFNVEQEKEYENVKDGGNIDDEKDEQEETEKPEEKEERAIWEPDKSKRGPRELSRDYDERKEQLNESFDAYDDEGEGFISNDRARQFMRDLFDITGVDSDIAIKVCLSPKRNNFIIKYEYLSISLFLSGIGYKIRWTYI